jgi:hypothetical protein|tara:strand:+ start:12155 stop:12382 length:228 start_codon:yes stop_codon:yes gene_type:complete
MEVDPTPSPQDNGRADRVEAKTEKKEIKFGGRAEIIRSKAELQHGKASKWKWLSIFIGIILAAFAAFKSKLGGFF